MIQMLMTHDMIFEWEIFGYVFGFLGMIVIIIWTSYGNTMHASIMDILWQHYGNIMAILW